jgi:hypothetical protein
VPEYPLTPITPEYPEYPDGPVYIPPNKLFKLVAIIIFNLCQNNINIFPFDGDATV